VRGSCSATSSGTCHARAVRCEHGRLLGSLPVTGVSLFAPAKLLAGIEPPDRAAEVIDQRFEDGTAMIHSCLERPALSCTHSRHPHQPGAWSSSARLRLVADLRAHRRLPSCGDRRLEGRAAGGPPVHPILVAFTDRCDLRRCAIAQRSAVDL
jgi:hypothetical protein